MEKDRSTLKKMTLIFTLARKNLLIISKRLFLIMSYLIKGILFVIFTLIGFLVLCFLNTNSKNENYSSRKNSPYMLDENGHEILDDGVTFGFELDDSVNYRNRF